ncbi:conjugative transposon protein TraM [Elizabethkingia anophelis]|uniref:conjugative transposon protein TraM n=3 Tax=Elizabethkingia anophelis TaxID=1117645 RepID=UPI00099997EF|nr:conjugative transposon protein TraM [Elizabethkingia anophelis]MCS7369689.1 conjugative transposon protein TraM [Elizabethkingia anophelis]MCS7375006.1 conjugative transposon protein TraM [Elizabethkingia anophelis]MCS7387337.1 conjugative transposon protein TraM [Elizabethkingia anophelis]HAY3597927.1 conjugative transposon protein TraM [Elizabethkingia anophelis]
MEKQQTQAQDNNTEEVKTSKISNGKVSIIKQKFDSLTIEQKLNYIAIPALILVFGAIGLFLYNSNNAEKSNKVSDFATPEAEVAKYNSKLDAVNAPANDDNITIQPVEQANTTGANSADDQVSIDNYSRQIDQNIQNQNNPTPVTRVPQTSASNAHNVYGDYDMWQNKEPANSKIGYSEKKWKQPIPQEKYDETPVVSKTKAPVVEEIYTSSYQQPSKNIAAAKQIPASLISSGYATDGSKVTLVLLEPTTIAGQQVKKGQAISGTVKEENGRMLVDVQTININKKIYQANIKVLAEDGIEGIYIGGGKGKNSRLGESARDAGGQVANNAISRIPIVGGVLGGVISGGGRRDSGQEPIKLNPGTRAIVVIY